MQRRLVINLGHDSWLESHPPEGNSNHSKGAVSNTESLMNLRRSILVLDPDADQSRKLVGSQAMLRWVLEALRLGFAGYIEKPINPETFVQEIRRYLTGEAHRL